MKIIRAVFSPIEVNTYIVTGNDEECIIIDCGCYGAGEEKRLEEMLEARRLRPVMLVDTHCHLDHVFGNRFMLERYGLRPWFHEGDRHNYLNAPKHALMFGLTMEAPPEQEGYLSEGETVTAAGLSLKVISVPGHSPGGIALYSESDGVVFTGDALFAGSIGRSDLPGGDHELLMERIREQLFTLPPDTVVYPGHGPATTIREEMKSNPFFS
ncbi:MAG: MBL fold metallo-hydrolase [Bacteroidales bacterium]|jgi:glyoxylase-like metal-dependent hydrolase (beta-lactamase superfamily II)|nr:MBL fold metallo-hydrolase [Bacteroidales bacterium]